MEIAEEEIERSYQWDACSSTFFKDPKYYNRIAEQFYEFEMHYEKSVIHDISIN